MHLVFTLTTEFSVLVALSENVQLRTNPAFLICSDMSQIDRVAATERLAVRYPVGVVRGVYRGQTGAPCSTATQTRSLQLVTRAPIDGDIVAQVVACLKL